jgi:large subunit ribosomal protein L21
MYAIVDFMGYQFQIKEGVTIKVPYIADIAVGSEIKIDKILMINSEENVSFGRPTIETATATVEVINHGRDKKIVVFKKKRRKGYRKTMGHKQNYSEIKVKAINH